MLGRTHVPVAAAAWVAVTLPTDLPLPALVASTVVAAGAGLAPDLDHPGATIARTHGAVSEAVAKLVEQVSGGHRGATHYAVTGLAVAVLVHLAAQAWPVATTVALAVTTGAWAARALCRYRTQRAWWTLVVPAITAAGMLATGWHPATPTWAGPAIAIGWLAHLAADATVTPTGGPRITWPSRHRHAWAILTPAGTGELIVGWASGAFVVVALTLRATTTLGL